NLDIRNANIYEVPLAMGLIQLVNLSLPTARSFDHASASYLLDGNNVKFDAIALEAPTVQIVGDGRMEYNSRKLDLNMTTRNAEGLAFGAITELLSGIKNELISIHVTGTLTEPKVEVRSFSPTKGRWDDALRRPPRDDARPIPSSPSPSPLGQAPTSEGQ